MATNKLTVEGIDLDNSTPSSPSEKIFNCDTQLADDLSEVRGFGKPISPRLAKKMFKTYYENYEDINDLLSGIKNGNITTLAQVKSHVGFDKLVNLLHPDKHIISGVFGKEILFQILSQKHCEGIRYIIGTSLSGKTTVILLGVEDIQGTEQDENEIIQKSKPVLNFNLAFDFKNIDDNSKFLSADPLIGEVHKGSKTVAEIEKIFGGHEELYKSKFNVPFGIL